MRRCRFDDLPPDLKEIWSTVVAEHASLDEGAGSLSDLVEEPASTDPYAAIIGKGAYSARSRYSQQTLTGMCSYFTRLANKALASGGHPRTLFECLEPALISSVLSDIEDGQKARAEARGVEHSSSNATLKGAATAMIALCSIAGRPEEEIERLKALRDRVDPSIIGIRKNSRTGGVTRIYSDERMGPKHKLMLQQFAGDAGAVKLRAYFTLPQLLLKPLKSKIQRRRPLHPVEIADYISALAILILQVCPVRRANLEGSLRIAGKNPTVSIPDNPREPVRLRVPASETKTRKRDVLAELPLEVSAVLREYVKHVRPQLMRNVGSGWDSGRLEFRADW
jgi:hypothetical protein